MAQFDAKIFNAEVFGKYLERIPRVKQNKLLESGVLRTRNELKNMLTDQAGGNYVTLPMKGLIEGTADNYDGSTDLTASSSKTYSQSMVVVGRAHGWIERDFSADITGEDFLDNVAAQINNFYDDLDQSTLLSILKGIFAMSANDFTTNHTYDITGETTNTVGTTTLNSAIQKAGGDNKNIFKLVICHSVVATNLENLSAINYLKYTDAKGVERDLGLATWNGRLVLVDDSAPAPATQGTYTVTIGGTVASGDKLTVDGTEVTLDGTSGASATAAATAIATALASNAHYTVTRSAAVLTLVEKSGQYGYGVPAVSKASTSGTITAATTTASVTNYVSYILGDGAFDFCDVGAKVPDEMFRDPKTNGGQDTLYTRRRKLFAPFGISFTKASMAGLSPTDAELENGANWELVNDGAASKTYINHKAIPIARIISQG